MSCFFSTTSADLLEEFLASEQPKCSKQGFDTIKKLSRQVLAWFYAEEISPTEITIKDAVRYAAYLSEYTLANGKPYDTGTVHNHLKAARRFFGFLVETERLVTNPFKEIRYPRMSEHISRNVLTEAQMGLLLHELEKFGDQPTPRERQRRYRVHVIAEFLYASGLRIAEACTIRPDQLDLDGRRLYLPQGKGGKARTALLTDYAVAVLRRYLDFGREIVLGHYQRLHGETLFGADKERVTSVVNGELKAVCTTLNIPVITSHGFRHSLGTHLLKAGCDMRHIQVILGHEALATTQIYTRVDKDDLKRSLDEFHPRQWHPVIAGEAMIDTETSEPKEIRA